MSKVNKHANIIIGKYDNYEEDNRFTQSKGTWVEFFTNMHYIHKYLKKGMKILEVGAGTGAYSIALAKEGYDVTAIELVESNLKVLRTNANGVKIKAGQGDALDLSRFEDESFDMVLNFGPMYHLFNKKDKVQAIKESVRVCKKNGIVMFAYLPHTSVVWNYGIKKQNIKLLEKTLDKTGRIKDVPEEIFSTFYVEDFKALTSKQDLFSLKTVSSDGIAYMHRDYIDALDEQSFNLFLKWHLSTCERADQLGWSSHILDVYKKK